MTEDSVGNDLFSYTVESRSFSVLESCDISCRSIIFTTTDTRGVRDTSACSTCTDLVDGEDAADDFDSCLTDTTTVTMIYKAGSKGRTSLTLRKECFTVAQYSCKLHIIHLSLNKTSVFKTYSFNFRIKFGSVEHKNRLKVPLNNYNFDFTETM